MKFFKSVPYERSGFEDQELSQAKTFLEHGKVQGCEAIHRGQVSSLKKPLGSKIFSIESMMEKTKPVIIEYYEIEYRQRLRIKELFYFFKILLIQAQVNKSLKFNQIECQKSIVFN